MKKVDLRLRCVLKFGIVLFLMVLTGCTHFAESVKTKGPVAWNYKQIDNLQGSDVSEIPGSFRVTDLNSKDPDFDGGGPSSLLRFLPLLSLYASPMVLTNHLRDDGLNKAELGDLEIEGILAGELTSNGMVKDVAVGGAPKDYDISGSIDFYDKRYIHSSGLGTLLLILTPPFALSLPMETVNLVGEAKFKVVSGTSGELIFEKDYYSEVKYKNGLFYGNLHKHHQAFGEEVFPQLVKAFIEDLDEIPPSAWQKEEPL